MSKLFALDLAQDAFNEAAHNARYGSLSVRAGRFDDDDAAIQNDTPAAHLDADERPVFGLRPLGVLAGPLDFHARSRAFSPRSPRGPPTAA